MSKSIIATNSSATANLNSPSSGRVTFTRPRRILLDVTVFIILLSVTLSLQWASGAYAAAFGAEPDEASHYVTGVMIHDYIAQGLHGKPVTFAKDFYLHYPRVAFGLWPPLFHVFSAVWMLPFGTSRMSVLFMLAVLASTWAFIFFRSTLPVLGVSRAVISALALVFLPATQKNTSAVMLDIPLALMMLLAAVAYARYLDSERTADAFLFGLYAAGAFLVKYNATALALLPPVCVAITGRHHLLRSRKFWLPAVVVLVLAGPWYVVMRHLVVYAADPGDSPPTGLSVLANVKGMIHVAGPIVFALALFGSVLVGLNMRKRLPAINNNDWLPYAVAVAMVLAVFLFHSAYPLFELRYSLPAAPALIFLAWPSIACLRSLMTSRPWLSMAVLFLIFAAHAAFTHAIPSKATSSYVRTAETVLASGLPRQGGLLVSADAVGEGMLTAEFVMNDNRPDHYVVRASKVLANQTLMGDRYQLRFHSAEEIMTELDSIPIAMVVIQQCPKKKCGAQEDLLGQARERYPERWRLSSVIPSENGSPILIYQIIGNESKSVQSLHIDMSPTLGTTVDKQ